MKKNEKVEKAVKEEVKGFLRFASPSITELVHFVTEASTKYCLMYVYEDFSKEKVVELLSKLEKAKRHLRVAIETVQTILNNWDKIYKRAIAKIEANVEE
jgi:hypothetical protein